MLRRTWPLLLVAMLAFVACRGEENKTDPQAVDRGECSEAEPPVDPEGLPSDFPVPDGVTFTDSTEVGPSVLISGYFDGDLEEAFPAFSDEFEGSDWDVTKDEQEANDAEVFFAQGETNGQVKLLAECNGRTKVSITIRPS